MADENGRGRKSKKEQPPQTKNSDVEKNSALLQAQAQLIKSPTKLDMPDTDVLPLSTGIFSTNSASSTKGKMSMMIKTSWNGNQRNIGIICNLNMKKSKG